MRRTSIGLLTLALLSSAPSAQAPAGKAMDIYFIDVEGGGATLIVSPSGESMLTDTGFPGNNGRDQERIAAVAKLAGPKRIDHLVITHYHGDHYGDVPGLAARIPIGRFVDHGETVERGEQALATLKQYTDVRDKGKHIVAKAGDSIPINGLNVLVLTSHGDAIKTPVPGAGEPNPLCAGFKPKQEDKTENSRSVGTLVTFGKFRFINLGDLTWNKEVELTCPNNLVGTVDLYQTSHHGSGFGSAEAFVHALRPRVAVMNNGAKKGGEPPAWQIVRASPGLEDFWQLHEALPGKDRQNIASDGVRMENSPETFIANLGETDTGHWIKVSAQVDGSFTVTNSRTGYTKAYKAGR